MPGKRRFSKKRGRRTRSKKLSDINIAKLNSRARYYIDNQTSNGIQTVQNDKAIYAIDGFFTAGCPGSQTSNENILASVGRETMGSATDAGGAKYYIHKNLFTMNLRNLESEPAIVTVYIFKNLTDIHYEDLNIDIATVGDKLVADLVRGWDIATAAGDVNLAGTGTYVQYAQGDPFAKVITDELYPSNSVDFLNRWGIVKKSMRKMAPGDDWFLSCKVPPVKYDPVKGQRIQSSTIDRAAAGYNATTSPPIAFKGMCRIPVIFYRGVIGKDSVTVGKYGWMTTDIYIGTRQTCRVLKLTSNQGYNMSINVSRDTDFTAGGLAGPSDFTQKVDDADD